MTVRIEEALSPEAFPGATRCALPPQRGCPAGDPGLAPGYLMPRLRRSSPIAFVGLLFLILFFSASAAAQVAQPVEDPQIEQRMKALTEQLRCLVCQNETLADSRADLAEDLRREIRREIKAGKSDPEIIAFLTQRYGDFILYNPPVKATTYLLWFGPFVILLAGIALLYRYLRRRKELSKDKPLTDGERKQAEDLLRGSV